MSEILVFDKDQQHLLTLQLKPSKQLRRLLIAFHLLALGACFTNSLPIIIQCVIFTAVLIQFRVCLKELGKEQVCIRHADKLGWLISDSLDFESVEVLATTITTHFVVFLHYRIQSSRHVLLVPNDSLDAQEFRCFIVRLKTSF